MLPASHQKFSVFLHSGLALTKLKAGLVPFSSYAATDPLFPILQPPSPSHHLLLHGAFHLKLSVEPQITPFTLLHCGFHLHGVAKILPGQK